MTSTVAMPSPAVPPPPVGQDTAAEHADERETFAAVTARTRAAGTDEADRAFVAARAHLLRTDPRLDPSGRSDALADLRERLGPADAARLDDRGGLPVPGGVGYGVFYTDAFRSAFGGGTSLYTNIVCPTVPGGNVSDFLYLTAMNRAGRGVEAFVSYHGADAPRFKVYDWARADHWQIDIPWADLTPYLAGANAHGGYYQALGILNSTIELAPGQWRNEASLRNIAQHRWDLVYRFDYAATLTDQTSGWTGSWGPIVETFQDSYLNTARFGALNTMLLERPSGGAWGSWHLCGGADSSIRTDNKGFCLTFIDPNHSFVVYS